MGGDGLLEQINHQIQRLNVTVANGCHVDASITHSPRKPKTRAAYEVVSDREERDDETDAQTSMRVIAVTQPGVDIEARWVSIRGQSVFCYKQHTIKTSAQPREFSCSDREKYPTDSYCTSFW